jgi:hypothetical protein
MRTAPSTPPGDYRAVYSSGRRLIAVVGHKLPLSLSARERKACARAAVSLGSVRGRLGAVSGWDGFCVIRQDLSNRSARKLLLLLTEGEIANLWLRRLRASWRVQSTFVPGLSADNLDWFAAASPTPQWRPWDLSCPAISRFPG